MEKNKRRRIPFFLIWGMICCCAFLPGSARAAESRVESIAVGINHCAAVKEDGSLWMWGNNIMRQLGLPDKNVKDEISTPTKVMENIQSVSLGADCTAALTKDGKLWFWGYAETERGICKPQVIMDGVKQVDLNAYGDGLVIKTDGSVWKLRGTASERVSGLDSAADISCGGEHYAVIKTDGSLWMWGDNSCGQLGVETGGTVPLKVMDQVKDVSLGEYHSAAVKMNGELWVWGSNAHGELGLGENVSGSADPVKVMDGVQSSETGLNSTAALKTDGSLWIWGHYVADVSVDEKNPIKAVFEPMKWMERVKTVGFSVLDYTFGAVKTDGSLWMWGYNERGQLGNGTVDSLAEQTVEFHEPVRILAVKKDIAACEITVKEMVYTGKEQRPDVTVKDEDVTLEEGTDYTVTYKNNINAGTAVAVVSGKGDYYNTTEKEFTIKKAQQNVAVRISKDHIAVGETAVITAHAVGTLSYSSSGEDIAAVDQEGKVTGVSAGIARITVTAAADQNHEEGSTVLAVTVVAAGSEDQPGGTPGADASGTVTVGKDSYQITSDREVTFKTTARTGKTVTVPATVKVSGVTYRVTAIAAGAFKGNKKITSVRIGKNVTSIGKNAFSGCTKLVKVSIGEKVKMIGARAFYGCRRLAKIVVKTKKLTNASVGNNAFKGIYARAVVRVPQKKLGAYKTILKRKGAGRRIIVRK